MKICCYGITSVPRGKHNLKDPRLDLVHALVEADKKTYAQADVTGDEEVLESDSVVTRPENLPDLLLQDLEFIETRLSRDAVGPEKTALEKLRAHLEKEQPAYTCELTPDERQALSAHRLASNRPIVLASNEELENPEPLMLRAFKEAGYICFLTVGGKENRAWPIRQGTTAWEAAGSIHTDLQKGFIRAEIISFPDFEQTGGETQAKRAGKQRLEMKPYVMQDFDLVNFRFSK